MLISTSFLDQCLASILGNFFIKSDTAKKLLDPGSGTLGTFSARADLCYCLDLISKELYQNLRTVAEIRNRFAHSHFFLSFEDSEVAELCNNLAFPKAWAIFTETVTGESYKPEDPFARFKGSRDKFTIIVVLMANRLLLIGLGMKQAKESKNTKTES